MNEVVYWGHFILEFLQKIRKDQDLWIMLTAIGTIAVAVVAVWKENLHLEPDLILEPENLEGSNVPLQTNDGRRITSCYYHLRVRNLKKKSWQKM